MGRSSFPGASILRDLQTTGGDGYAVDRGCQGCGRSLTQSWIDAMNESNMLLLLACQRHDSDDHSDDRADLGRLAMGTISESDGH